MSSPGKSNDRPKIPWRVDPDVAAGRREFARFHLAAPPQNPLGVEPPFCPFVAGCFGHVLHASEKIVVAGQESQQIQVRLDQIPLACFRDRCLFWDRVEVRCGFTSLLDMMLGEDDEELDAPGEPAEGGGHESPGKQIPPGS
jgi:hypothetical protein